MQYLRRHRFMSVLPGLAVSIAIAIVAEYLAYLELLATGFVWFDGLVLAIIIGTLIHTVFGLPDVLMPGIRFSAKFLLELAIVLLGATISASTIADAGLIMIGIVFIIVIASLIVSYNICRFLGLSDHLATLVACGNSICGNSAIVAAAPVIDAGSDDIASSIAFTAALGIIVVLLLPMAFTIFNLTELQYGVIAGMTVYAVPQVLAATSPIGVISTQVGTIVKLMRVLMLGPVILLLGIKNGSKNGVRLPLRHMVPWFIIGFFVMMLIRTLDVIPHPLLAPVKDAATALTIVSMAALGLSVNLLTVLASGGRVLLAGTMSILALAAMSALALMILPAV